MLAPFRKLTKHNERREISLQDYIPIFDKIIDHLQKTSQRFKRQAESQNASCAIFEWLLVCTELGLDKAKALYKKIEIHLRTTQRVLLIHVSNFNGLSTAGVLILRSGSCLQV